MADVVYMACATGNWETASTWKASLLRTLTGAYLHSEAGAAVLTTAYSGARTAAFTPGVVEIDGIGLRLHTRTGTTGTMSVHLILSSDNSEVAGTEVVIDTADLPAPTGVASSHGWTFFKFAAPVTLLAATAYKVEAKTSSATQVTLWRDGTAGNLSRFIRTTTTGAPGADAGGEMVLCREYTGQGTSTAYTVTMDVYSAASFGPNHAASASLSALEISDGCTLTWPRTQTTYLRLLGNLLVCAGGTYDMGSSASRIPSAYTASLCFYCATNGIYGMWVKSGATVTAAGVVRNRMALLTTDEAISSAVWGVSDTTGWEAGDAVVISQSATATTTGAEATSITTVDSSTQVTVTSGLTAARSGTAPYQAEVINRFANVYFQGFGPSFNGFINIGTAALPFALGSVVLDNVGTAYMGMATAGREGISMALSGTSTVSILDCMFGPHYTGVRVNGTATGNAVTIDGCCAYALTNAAFYVGGTNTGTLTITDNCAIQCGASNVAAFTIAGALPASSTFSGNRAANGVGTTNVGFSVNAPSSTGATTMLGGTFANNIAHNCRRGFVLHVSGGTLTGCKAWRCDNYGLVIGAGSGAGWIENITFDQCVFGACSTGDIIVLPGSSMHSCLFKNGIVGAGSSPTSPKGLLIQGDIYDTRFESNPFGTLGGYAHSGNPIDIAATGVSWVDLVIDNGGLYMGGRNTTFRNMLSPGSRIAYHDTAIPGYFNYDTNAGGAYPDGGTTHSGGVALMLIPDVAARKTTTPPYRVPVASGQTVTPSVYVNEGVGYNGARARLIVKRNLTAGITADTVLDTATAASDNAWEQLTGTTDAVAANCVLEFTVDCDGSGGSVTVDDFTA